MDKTGNNGTAEELLPIDIYYNKLLDWLLDRRHCDIKWQAAALEIREKINAAIQDMPPVEEITTLLSGTFINYFHCLRIVELLKVSESGTKNIFGGYSSKRMKDWQEIIRLYEKDNVYLAEAASLLIRNVNYEIPSLKRQIGKCQQTQRECTRKENEYTTNAAEYKEQYRKVCKKMGIKGESIKTELLHLLKELPDVYQTVSESTKDLQDTIQYYKVFIGFVAPSFIPNVEESSPEISPLLSYILEHGNTTVYQWRTGKVPTTIKSPELQNLGSEKEDLQAPAEIDWGESAATSEEIDWGDGGGEIDFGDGGVTSNEIDWGHGSAAEIDFGDNIGGDGIDWGDSAAAIDITLDKSGTNGIMVESPDDGADVAQGSDAHTLLEDTQTRNMFIDELMELQGFLSQRLSELRKDSDVVSDTQLQSAPRLIQMQTKKTVEKMLCRVEDVLEQLTNMRVQNLCLLKSSPRYVGRLADSLQQKLRLSEKLLSSAQTMCEKRKEAAEQQRELEPKLDVIRQKTKDMQSQIAGEISKKYKDRPVNIMGEINSI
ncbi:CDK5 regulatory subunit-associated protein 3 [Nematostella vectensis]|uniref:CDK5 regulatory subunit-associated protein 3 n=1 Tax=Nematostella vectensis TaxID=45351 RepID=UPI0020771199|nr:CDK5 regulatory subunit-associated protein 3 [Nematostella vectensis]